MRAHGLSLRPVAIIVGFNLAAMLCTYETWHVLLYSRPPSSSIRERKFNKEDQYGPPGNLLRERLLTTAGWLQSSAFQCAMMWLWSQGRVAYLPDFFQPKVLGCVPLPLLQVAAVTYWRELHFYWCHRFMHPWGWSLCGVDIGAFMYKHVHKVHHRSKNPGPWSGLSMHPVEHLLYYSVTLLPLLLSCTLCIFSTASSTRISRL